MLDILRSIDFLFLEDMKRKFFGFFFFTSFFLPLCLVAQDSLFLSREACEAIFLEHNLALMAQKMNIDVAEAKVIQAGLWPNPTLEIEEVNLWTATRGVNNLNYFGDELPGFGGGQFGKNQQISISIEQLILTAGKRKKLVAMEEVSVEKSKQYFEEILRHLKLGFRQMMTNLQYFHISKSNYENQRQSISQLVRAIERQVENGHIPRGEWIRLKAVELEILRHLHELNNEIHEVQKELRQLMHLPAHTYLIIDQENFTSIPPLLPVFHLDDLIEEAKIRRPDLQSSLLEQQYYDHLYEYEKAQRVPNLTLKAGYDRGGNFMYNFLGMGLSIDLPLFARNQGNIQAARIGRLQSQIIKQEKEHTVENEIFLAYQNLLQAIGFLEDIEVGYENSLEDTLERYTENFVNRNISLLEYLDYLEAYLDNKNILLEARKELLEKVEELNYTVGREVVRINGN